MDADITVTQANSNDATEIADLWTTLAAGQREYGSHIRAETNREQIHRSVLRHIAGDRVLIARQGELTGFVMFSIERGTFEQDRQRGFVENLFVRPEERNDGIGSALLDAAERALRDRGAEVVALNVMARNEGARRFYRRHGYDPYRVELEKELTE